MVRIYTFVGLCAGTYVGLKALDNLVVWIADRREANAENFKIDREASRLKQQLLQEIKEKQASTDKVLEKHDTPLDKKLKKQWNEYNLVNKHQEEKLHKLLDKHFKEHDDAKLTRKYHEEERQNLPEKPQKKQGDSKSPNKDHEVKHPSLPDKPLKQVDPKFPEKGHVDTPHSKSPIKDHEDKRPNLSDKPPRKQVDSKFPEKDHVEKGQDFTDKPLKKQGDPQLHINDKRQNPADTGLKKLINRNLTSSPLEDCPGEVVAECLECGEVFEIVEPIPHKVENTSRSSPPENCPGEIVAEYLECETVFEIVEPVPHSPERRADK